MLSAFPSITEAEFAQACQDLAAACEGPLEGTGWLDVKWTGRELQIRQQRIERFKNNSHEGQETEDLQLVGIEDSDLEAISRSAPQNASSSLVDFSIVLSPSYQVPVLWFRFSHETPANASALHRVYDVLVSPSARDGLQQVGILGGISIANHPVSHVPAFFIHPCRTQEAIATVRPAGDITPLEYLLLWLGVLGASVGLSVPNSVAVKIC